MSLLGLQDLLKIITWEIIQRKKLKIWSCSKEIIFTKIYPIILLKAKKRKNLIILFSYISLCLVIVSLMSTVIVIGVSESRRRYHSELPDGFAIWRQDYNLVLNEPKEYKFCWNKEELVTTIHSNVVVSNISVPEPNNASIWTNWNEMIVTGKNISEVDITIFWYRWINLFKREEGSCLYHFTIS
jgi:peptidoglycan/LPS O-acetylase OafA/YrhL